jgi:hypothetical protein
MSQSGIERARPFGSAWFKIWQVLALILGLYVIEQDVEALLWSMHRLPAAGSVGLDPLHDTEGAPQFAPGYVKANHVEPGSPLANAGLTIGDHLRYDPTWHRMLYPRVGEVFRVTIDHHGQKVSREVVAGPRSQAPSAVDTADAIFELVNLITGLFAVFILWRGGGKAAALLLGLALSSFSLVWISPQMLEGSNVLFPALHGLNNIIYGAIFPLFLAFAVRYREETLGRRQAWEWALVIAYGAFYGMAVGLQAWYRWNIVSIPLVGNGAALTQFLTYPGGAACLYFLFSGWRRSGPIERGRYAFLLIGFAAILISQIVIEYVDLGLNDPNFTANPLVSILCNFLIGVVAPILFAYAILRHRVLDLGFAVNRTLVYTLVSAILLTAFGVIEWAVDHLVSIDGREKNALVDAAIAVAVFLTFHRVRDTVEHGVERLFFHRWKMSADALRQFVKMAAFASKAETLTRGLALALTDYTDGATTAVYLLEGGAYRLAAGTVDGVGETLEPDDPALMMIRAQPKALVLDQVVSALKAAMIAPMVHRNEVIGLTVLGAKPGGLLFRPDEVELVGWATSQVGLDLHSLKVEQLESSEADLLKTVTVLERALSLRTA